MHSVGLDKYMWIKFRNTAWGGVVWIWEDELLILVFDFLLCEWDCPDIPERWRLHDWPRTEEPSPRHLWNNHCSKDKISFLIMCIFIFLPFSTSSAPLPKASTKQSVQKSQKLLRLTGSPSLDKWIYSMNVTYKERSLLGKFILLQASNIRYVCFAFNVVISRELLTLRYATIGRLLDCNWK